MRCLLLALVVACSPAPHPAAPPPAPPAAPAVPTDAVRPDAAPPPDAASADAFIVDAAAHHFAKQGEVCRLGVRHQAAGGSRKPATCAPGLQCCYPCGIEGCDDVCMTPAECSSPRP